MPEMNPEIDYDLAHFFAWARARAYTEFDRRMKADPSLDPNWTFSDIMQSLLEEYRRMQQASLHDTLSDE